MDQQSPRNFREAVKIGQANARHRLSAAPIVRRDRPEGYGTHLRLKNADPEGWRDKREVEHSGEMTVATKEQRMPQLLPQPAPTPEDFAFSRLIGYAAYQWPGYIDAPHHRLIARHLEAVERGEITRLMITMPPRRGKEYAGQRVLPGVVSRDGTPITTLSRRPTHKSWQTTSAARSRTRSKMPLTGDLPRCRAGRRFQERQAVSRRRQSWRLRTQLAQRGAFYAVGVGGPLTGRGAHLLLIDDPVKNREDADSEIIRRKTRDWQYIDGLHPPDARRAYRSHSDALARG